MLMGLLRKMTCLAKIMITMDWTQLDVTVETEKIETTNSWLVELVALVASQASCSAETAVAWRPRINLIACPYPSLEKLSKQTKQATSLGCLRTSPRGVEQLEKV
jgi:hypothetical protein